uniref:Uncharacterized protein n=1 Tax=Anguilla anguilla TaxID=7936 RepID=A0A0E9PX20_ANGAN
MARLILNTQHHYKHQVKTWFEDHHKLYKTQIKHYNLVKIFSVILLAS